MSIMEFTNQFINREHHPVDVTLIYLSQKSFRQFQVPRSRRRDVMTATSDPFGKRDFGGHWISLIHPTVMITPQKRCGLAIYWN